MTAAVALAAVLLATGFASDVQPSDFRYTRTLAAPSAGPVTFEPDGAMYGHARIGFPDLRILDADGVRVPWRAEPRPAALPFRPVALIARGRRDRTVSVVVDQGAARPVIDRIQLEIPDSTFTGRVAVQGSATGAEGSYAMLSTTPIYSVRGAVNARSTTAVFPPTDYRYLLVQARGVSDITGASVARDPEDAPLAPVAATTQTSEHERATVVRVDLGHRNVPVDAVRVRSSTRRYVRQVRIDGSNDGTNFVRLAQDEVARFAGVDLTVVGLDGHHRFLRVTIANGDDVPLEALQVTPEATSREVLLAGGHHPPFRVFYGAAVAAPAYDFARLPPAATGFEAAVGGTLGPESVNELFEPAADTRTFFERNDAVLQVLLVVAAIVAAVGGFLALRRRA